MRGKLGTGGKTLQYYNVTVFGNCFGPQRTNGKRRNNFFFVDDWLMDGRRLGRRKRKRVVEENVFMEGGERERKRE